MPVEPYSEQRGDPTVMQSGRDSGGREEQGMVWNYRAVKHVEHDETTYCIHEVYYDDDGNIEAWTSEPVRALGETLEELRSDLATMLYDSGRFPALDMAELRE